MNIAVVDDCKSFVDEFCKLIKNYCDKNNVKYKTDAFYDGYSILESYGKYDLIFLDIEMPMIDGIEIAEKINKFKSKDNVETPYIVFVTNKDNLVFTALKQFPYTFIRKEHFGEDIEKCIVDINKKLNVHQSRYPVKVGRITKLLSPENILYIEKDKNYVIFHTADNQYRERSNIDDKLNDLLQFGFIRTHVGYLVNLKYVSEISSSEIILINGKEIPISKSYRQSVKEQYFNWVVKQ
ncbi:MAG: LytR/AlgR family response regulator transcription factor [Ruminococcus sp.]